MQHCKLLARGPCLEVGISTFCRRLRQLIISIHIDLSVWTVNTSRSLPPPHPGLQESRSLRLAPRQEQRNALVHHHFRYLSRTVQLAPPTRIHQSIFSHLSAGRIVELITARHFVCLTASVLKGTATSTAHELHRHFTTFRYHSVDLSRRIY